MSNYRVSYVTQPQAQQDGAGPSSNNNAQRQRQNQSTSQSIVLPAGNRTQSIVLPNGQPILLGERVLVPAGMALVPANIQTTWQGGQVAKVIHGSFPTQMVLSTAPISQITMPYVTSTTQAVQPSTSNTTWVMQQPTTQTSTSTGQSTTGQKPTSIIQQSSTTPDSGIQSVPTSPPSPNMVFTPSQVEFDTDDRGDDFDFADMPRLLPLGEEDDSPPCSSTPTPQKPVQADPEDPCSTPCTSSSSGKTQPCEPSTSSQPREDGQSHGSECETSSAPSFSISTNMDSDEIATKLLEFNPEMASKIASILKQRSQKKRKTSADRNTETAGSSTVVAPKRPRSSRAVRKETEQAPEPEAIQVDESLTQESSPKQAAEELKSKKRKVPKTAELTKKSKVEQKTEVKEEEMKKEEEVIADMSVAYRLAVEKQLKEEANRHVEKCIEEMASMKIDHSLDESRRRKKDIFTKMMSGKAGKSKKEKAAHRKVTKEEPKVEKARVSLRTNMRQSTSIPPEEEVVPTKFNGEYEEIPKSVPWAGDDRIPKWWESPPLQCGCTRGACTSDVECINRALRIQCSPTCNTLCANKKFWRNDLSRLAFSSGPLSRRHLKTKTNRRAGDFLCEYAGEVVTYDEARRRVAAMDVDSPNRTRCMAITQRLFIDASKKGNVSRVVRHSCEPNSRIEVWSIGGRYRAGIFSLYDISSNSEITIDKNGLLPIAMPCKCGAPTCKKVIGCAKSAIRANAADLTSSEESDLRESRRLLVRNRRFVVDKARRTERLPTSWTSPAKAASTSPMRRLVDGVLYRVQRADGTIPHKTVAGYHGVLRTMRELEKTATPGRVPAKFEDSIKEWLKDIDDDDIDRAYLALLGKVQIDEESGEKKKKKTSTVVQTTPPSTAPTTSSSLLLTASTSKLVNRQTDLSYLDSKWPIGSYNPDEAWSKGKANAGDNAVRCPCGSLEEDGDMLQCDSCHFWLHMDCLGVVDSDADYTCQFCTGSIKHGVPSTDVLLATQPDVRFQSCSYFRSLVNRRSIQVRLNETVFVLKSIGDEHKQILKQLVEQQSVKKKGKKDSKANFPEFPEASTEPLARVRTHRKDSRIFRVERLFTAPGGNKFVFGFYYARPHETFCDSQRIFHTHELFATPFYDTLPLDSVIGRCSVLDGDIWCRGRPTVPLFKEEDVYLCDYQIDRSQRSFEKIPPKMRYFINVQPYAFKKFDKPLELKRDFTPFILNDRSGCSTPVGKSPSNKKSETSKKAMNIKKNASRNLNAIVSKLSAKVTNQV